MSARAQEVADELIGTAKLLTDAATDEEIDSKDFMEALDALVFECELCGWWCGEEENNDFVCDDCSE